MEAIFDYKIRSFIPYYFDQNYPQEEVATLEIFLKLGLNVDYSLKQTFCRHPFASDGSENDARFGNKIFEYG